mmetsp:Transcript_976/g.1466  ORF Transcript_976/g.1466 Transcript_976/m.1466 type:complete len:228 (-) Transcript_976:199-882(-)
MFRAHDSRPCNGQHISSSSSPASNLFSELSRDSLSPPSFSLSFREAKASNKSELLSILSLSNQQFPLPLISFASTFKPFGSNRSPQGKTNEIASMSSLAESNGPKAPLLKAIVNCSFISPSLSSSGRTVACIRACETGEFFLSIPIPVTERQNRDKFAPFLLFEGRIIKVPGDFRDNIPSAFSLEMPIKCSDKSPNRFSMGSASGSFLLKSSFTVGTSSSSSALFWH